MTDITQNANSFRESISNTCEENGVSLSDIDIILATKKQSIEDMLIAKIAIPNAVFGENLAQELVKKYDANYLWDYIGRIQTNKLKFLVGRTRLIQSVDRLEIFEILSKVCENRSSRQSVLIQINAGDEESKGGVLLKGLDNFINTAIQYENIMIEGLMVMTPANASTQNLESMFLDCKYAFDNYHRKDASFCHLSMGMTNDYKIAIKCGSNMIRVGRAIFGDRDKCNV